MSALTLTQLPDTIGTAHLIGNFENGTDEWHELRTRGIGGSDIAAAVGCSPWTSPFALWAKKTGRIPDTFIPSEAADWGNRLEPVVLDRFAELRPDLTLHRNVGTWAHAERHWQLANPDALYETTDGRFGIVEVKTSRYEDDWTNGVPAYYRTQAQWYAQTFGFDTTIYVVALFAGSKFKVYEVQSDSFEQTTNLTIVEKFRTYLIEDTQPDFDGALSTLTTVRELNPLIDDEANDVELAEIGHAYLDALSDFTEAEARLNLEKSRVLDRLGAAKRGLIDGIWRVTRQSRNGGIPYIQNKKG